MVLIGVWIGVLFFFVSFITMLVYLLDCWSIYWIVGLFIGLSVKVYLLTFWFSYEHETFPAVFF